MQICSMTSHLEKCLVKPAVKQQFAKIFEKSYKKSAYNICGFGKSL